MCCFLIGCAVLENGDVERACRPPFQEGHGAPQGIYSIAMQGCQKPRWCRHRRGVLTPRPIGCEASVRDAGLFGIVCYKRGNRGDPLRLSLAG